MLVALGSGRFALPAKVEAAAEITAGLLKSDGAAARDSVPDFQSPSIAHCSLPTAERR